MRVGRYIGWKGYVEAVKSSRAITALPAIILAVSIAHLPVPEGLTDTSMRLLGVFAGGATRADAD
ncbi:hypothetical protein LPJ77_003781 [Coemansia sp. RSA 2523]|nr:hypothetical protein LPJ77_003781 [Coemansia sp. RSA 2523]